LLTIALDHWQPGTLAAKLANYAFIAYGTFWFAFSVRKGFLLRRPYWTRESWMRYLRLAAIPVAAIAVVLYLSSFDSLPPVFGPRGSATRRFFVIAMVLLLLFGAGGLAVAVNWLTDGEPSQQFTRTRWFQRQRPKVIAQ
jgi:hypothetical protein